MERQWKDALLLMTGDRVHLKPNMTPNELAHLTMMQLSQSRMEPTPENYRHIYNMLAGVIAENNAALLHPSQEKVSEECSLIESASMDTAEIKPIAPADDHQLAACWRDMMIKTIELLVFPQLTAIPAAISGLEAQIKRALESQTLEQVNALDELLKSSLLRIEIHNESQHRIHDALIQMLSLMLSSLGEWTREDHWLHGQVAILQDIISKPLNIESVFEAKNSLKALIFKQSTIKPGLLNTRLPNAGGTLENTIGTFVRSLADITEMSEANRLGTEHNQVLVTEYKMQLDALLQKLVGDISSISANAGKTFGDFHDPQKKVDDAQKQINELSIRLDYINEVAQRDFLTEALNRRGMDDAIAREFSRADRHDTPISLVIIDMDHFKEINDRLGHAVGDVALAHLAKMLKCGIRGTDVLARFGGDEFVILLPGSSQDAAVKIVGDLQQDLTQNLFQHGTEHILMTFSAGVTERLKGEPINAVFPRADTALYQAKQTGRNCVVAAELP